MLDLLMEVGFRNLDLGTVATIGLYVYLLCNGVFMLRQNYWQGSKLKWESKKLEIQYRQKKKKSAEGKRTRKRKK